MYVSLGADMSGGWMYVSLGVGYMMSGGWMYLSLGAGCI